MESAFVPFICAAGFLLLGYPISFLFWRWIIQKGWLSLRLVALCLSLGLGVIGTTIWLSTRDDTILIFIGIFILVGNLVILTMPRTSPSLMKLLRIKW